MSTPRTSGAAPQAPAVEIAVQDVAGVRAAVAGGADRVELCQALGVGGLTPSAGLIERAVTVSPPGFVQVLIRPRPGGFVYDIDERETIVADVRAAVAAGAGGVVVGALDDEGALDVDAIAAFVDAADGAEVTVHRCVDAAESPLRAVARLPGLGITRVLTSGAAPRAIEGVPILAAMRSALAGTVQLMAGGGVQPADVASLAAAGADAVHLSARRRVARGGPAGPGGGALDEIDETDPAIVRAAVAAATSRG